MFTFSELIKAIRHKAELNQEEFAEKLGVSKIFIAQLETNKREPSKNFIKILSKKLQVSSFSLMPLLSNEEIHNYSKLSFFEQKIYDLGVKLQNELIEKKYKYLVEG